MPYLMSKLNIYPSFTHGYWFEQGRFAFTVTDKEQHLLVGVLFQTVEPEFQAALASWPFDKITSNSIW